jgi:hypothetical protein
VTVQDLLARLVAALDAPRFPAWSPASMRARFTASHGRHGTSTSSSFRIGTNSRGSFARCRRTGTTRISSAIDALKRSNQFHVIDYATGWKVDFIIPPMDEFHEEEFHRRRRIDVDGLQLTVVSPEDIVIAKLLWARAGESERQIEDAGTVVRSQGSNLDVAYIQKWVRKLGIEQQWRLALTRAGGSAPR